LKSELKTLTKLNAVKQSKAQADRSYQETLLRVKNINNLSKWSEFRLKKESTIRAYVVAIT
jgi:hypothetical protein